MTHSLGKRKRSKLIDQELTVATVEGNTTDRNPNALFKQYFEDKFEPLPVTVIKPIPVESAEEGRTGDESTSDWEGISEDNENGAEMFEHTTSNSSKTEVPREELRSFMTSKPPSSKSTVKAKEQDANPTTKEELDTDAANLKNDLALQRLLKESHLLDSHSSLSVTGKNRHKALDLRLQDLGSKSSIFVQQKMPLAQRKGILAKAAGKEELRRREASENGIILETKARGKKGGPVQRQRSIGGPSVGRFQGGMLKLSKKDVAEIEGPKRSVKRGKR